MIETSMGDRLCESCGAFYTPGRKDQRFCSPECRKHRPNGRQPVGEEVPLGGAVEGPTPPEHSIGPVFGTARPGATEWFAALATLCETVPAELHCSLTLGRLSVQVA